MGNHWRSLDCRRHLNRINICYSVERLLIVRLVSKASSIWLWWVMDVYCTSKCRGQVNSSAAALWPCWKIICIHVDTRHFIRRPPLLPVRLSSCFVTCFLLIGLIPALFFILLPVLNRLDCLQLSQHPHTLTHTHTLFPPWINYTFLLCGFVYQSVRAFDFVQQQWPWGQKSALAAPQGHINT